MGVFGCDNWMLSVLTSGTVYGLEVELGVCMQVSELHFGPQISVSS